MNLTNLHQVAQGKILERRDLAAAGQDATVQGVARRHAKRWRIRDLDWTTAGDAVLASINAGRWFGACPDCGGGEYLNIDEPAFWCCSCANVSNGHRPRPVIFPAPAEREAIASVLLERPGPVLPGAGCPRNWHPGEDVDLLVAENLERGHRVPPGLRKGR